MTAVTATTTPEAPEAPVPVVSRGKIQLPRSPKLLIGLGVLDAFILLAIVGPLVAPFDPSASLSTTNGVPQAPSAAHWLGTTQVQQDVFSQLLVGGRSTIVVAFIAGIVATALSMHPRRDRPATWAGWPTTCCRCWPTSSWSCRRCRC